MHSFSNDQKSCSIFGLSFLLLPPHLPHQTRYGRTCDVVFACLFVCNIQLLSLLSIRFHPFPCSQCIFHSQEQTPSWVKICGRLAEITWRQWSQITRPEPGRAEASNCAGISLGGGEWTAECSTPSIWRYICERDILINTDILTLMFAF